MFSQPSHYPSPSPSVNKTNRQLPQHHYQEYRQQYLANYNYNRTYPPYFFPGVTQPAATPAPAAPVSPAPEPAPAPAPAPKVQEPPKDPDYSQYGLYPKKVNAELEDLYVKKLKDLQEKHAELNKKTNEQFAQAVQEVEGKFLDYTAVPVCQDLQSALLQCYQENPHEILKCSSVVNAFSVCVERARIPFPKPHHDDSLKDLYRYPLLLQAPESRVKGHHNK